MKSIKMKARIILSAIVLFCSSAFADRTVIVHPSYDGPMDAEIISDIFLGKSKSLPNGMSANPLNQTAGSDIRIIFDDKILGKSASQLKAYWSKIIFTGKGSPPPELSSGEEVKAKVAADPHAIGYIDKALIDDSVRAVLDF